MSLPKTLIIGQPFNNNFGGGITQANLFGGWDKDKIAVLCTSHMFNNLNTEICDTYYILGNDEYKWSFPLNFLQRNIASGPVKVRESPAGATAGATGKLRTKIIDKYFYPFLEYAGLFHRMSKITLSDKLCKWLDDYAPDVIYAQATSREGVLFCIAVQEYLKMPMIYHVMDDWPSTISQKGPFKKFWHKRIDRELRTLLNRSTILLSISHDMAEEYKTRYGRDFTTFHNPIEIDFWKSHQRKNYELGSSPAILYAGRIGPGIDTSLETIARAVEQVNSKFNRSVQFVLQTKDKPVWVDKYKCVRHKELVAYSELPRVFAEADFLYLPYDFSEESIRFIKFSMPTKAPEYMISGTPIIMFGPGETALMKDGKRNNWAKVVTENNIEALAEAINDLVTNDDMRKEIAANAIRIAEANYNSVKIRNQFKEVISSIAS
ncbi:MAG TPA: glycosyltransferase [Ferruginibacter sp.]|nr:glycosyltransferase [Ferruginibacter sp.]